MAQRDLDAALQLLADRAQYITGASGAAIALRRDGCNDMLCRASAGSNAPELGALLSTEFGLSGESVRTGQPLRCDDAERDARVNREVCRQLGIASVVVMPVVNDDQVLGVFELFSGTANAFGERDLSAVQRLSEMVETAVRFAHAEAEAEEGQFLSDLVAEEPEAPAVEGAEEPKDVVQRGVQAAPTELPKAEVVAPPAGAVTDHAPAQAASHDAAPPEATRAPVASPATAPSQPASSPALSSSAVSEPASPTPARPAESNQTHVPPVPAASSPSVQAVRTPAPELVLSAGLAPPQSWLSRNKYILGVLLIAGAAAAFFLLR